MLLNERLPLLQLSSLPLSSIDVVVVQNRHIRLRVMGPRISSRGLVAAAVASVVTGVTFVTFADVRVVTAFTGDLESFVRPIVALLTLARFVPSSFDCLFDLINLLLLDVIVGM